MLLLLRRASTPLSTPTPNTTTLLRRISRLSLLLHRWRRHYTTSLRRRSTLRLPRVPPFPALRIPCTTRSGLFSSPASLKMSSLEKFTIFSGSSRATSPPISALLPGIISHLHLLYSQTSSRPLLQCMR
uniref:Uncharacterized protein n=1 Tax=Opuntia streptacantha TaxID=393608 RepID=A0A7C8Z2N5_OPUST